MPGPQPRIAASSADNISILAMVGHQPRTAQRLVQKAFPQALQRNLFQFRRQGQSAAFDRNSVPVACIASRPVDSDEGRIVEAEAGGEFGVLDDFKTQGTGFGIRAGIGQRLRPAYGVINHLAVKGDERTDTYLGGDEASVQQFLQSPAHGIAADRKTLDEFAFALQSLAKAEGTGPDFFLQHDCNLFGLSHSGR